MKTSAPKKSLRPKARPADLMEGEAVKRGDSTKEREVREDAPLKKMAGGGMCRGMGAATKGGKYRMG